MTPDPPGIGRLAILAVAQAAPVGAVLATLIALRRRGRLDTGPALEIPLAIALGSGLAMAPFVAWLALPTSLVPLLASLEIALLVAAVGFLARSPAAPSVLPPGRRAGARDRMLGAALGLAAAGAGFVFVSTARGALFGHWDAWAMWNSRARFLALAPDGWRAAFEVSGFLHPDYPFLLPAAVARLWTYTGELGFLEPIAVAAAFAAATAGVLFAGLLRLRGFASAALATLFLLGATSRFHGLDSFPHLAALQLADVPVGCFYLASLALVAGAPEGGPARGGHLVLAGLSLSLAAWTKNEGAAFAVAFFVVYALVRATVRGREATRESALLLAGAAPGAAAWVAYKLLLAPPGDLFSPSHTGLWEKVTDPARHVTVASILLENALRFGAGALLVVLAVALLLGVRGRGGGSMTWFPVLVVLGALACEYLVLVLTPHEPAWHATSAWSRLLSQLWPSLLFAVFGVARSPGEAEEAVPSPAAL